MGQDFKIECTAGLNYFSVKPNGDYRRCLRLNNIIGNVVDGFKPLKDIGCKELNCIDDNGFTNSGKCVMYNTTRYIDKEMIKQDREKGRRAVEWKDQTDSICFHWNLTYNCNFNCIYCGQWRSRGDTEMTIEQLDKFFSKLEIATILLTGGEPSIAKNFKYIMKRLLERGDSLLLFTNLSNVETLKEVFSWGWKNLTVYASCHFTNPNFNLAEFTELAKIAPNLVITFVEYEKEYIMKYKDYFEKKGFEKFIIQPLINNNNPTANIREKYDF